MLKNINDLISGKCQIFVILLEMPTIKNFRIANLYAVTCTCSHTHNTHSHFPSPTLPFQCIVFC